MNNTRGLFAEFLVHRALNSRRTRVEWASHDVETDDGLRVEVKAAAYLQAWEQRTPSQIRFGGLRARTWSPDRGYAEAKTYNADVYVFAVQAAREHDAYDPLDISQWEFYALPRPAIAALGTDSVSLVTVRAAAGAASAASGFRGLGERIRAVDPRISAPDEDGYQ